MNNSCLIDQAASLLQAGQCVVIPTETVYGLAANATKDTAVAQIYALKQRPSFNPLIAHYASLEAMGHDVILDTRAQTLARFFWPGPLTLVLNKQPTSRLSLLATAGLDTAAVRIPHHPLALELLQRLSFPLAAPSANRSGKISPTCATHVLHDLGQACPLIFNGGPCKIGLESTILDLTEDTPKLLRPGAITQAMLEEVLGPISHPYEGETLKAPGQLTSHYAPALPVRLNAQHVEVYENLLAFGTVPFTIPATTTVMNLSTTASLTEAAANLFKMMRALDEGHQQGIAVMPIPEVGLGDGLGGGLEIALNDRLRRAAASR